MKILAFAASNSRNSINRTLVAHAAAQLQSDIQPGAEIEILDLNDFDMPVYSIDRETESGIPAQARAFFDAIGAADAVLVSFAEHNGTVTSAWKNIFDWMSRIDMKVWQGKPVVFLAATPGPRAGAGVLSGQEQIAPFFGADLRGVLGVGIWSEAWDAENGVLARAEDVAALDKVLTALVAEPDVKEEAA
ncbi:NADPH-dependent FMN reductase [Pseudohoeflea coraliihabitans]|uniref:NAD(P)H-dependent oxidoreductase n=1 Tax=Pseudohoeflea coraliihabitans TaxID=2860393 RepID=A0ABS6WTH3_9HYPH|nr:NAD(P)H-dependent oxidoreductase [Pseudohoeflea sp. DP4N28-3]MBW3098354.1 NAD(P)H-dependent oxidoreductase [Pseudohoeflea sp. DP4N28-3]